LNLLAHAAQMGWTFGEGKCEALRFTLRQGDFAAKVVCKGARAVARYGTENGGTVAILGYDENGCWATGPKGEPMPLEADLLDEFMITIKLFTNDLSGFVEMPYDGGSYDDTLVKSTTLLGPNNVKIDLFFWPTGQLAGSLLRMPRRAVRLMPIARVEEAGRNLHSAWIRDNERPIEIVDIRIGGPIFEAELRRKPIVSR
jgi:hypothetical protein